MRRRRPRARPSPEQARGESVNGASDIYSLALVLVEAVTGTVPFSADTTIATLMARLEHPLVVPEVMGPLTGILTSRIGFANALIVVGILPLAAAGLLVRFPRDDERSNIRVSERVLAAD